jgi:hypothetical protein
MIASTLDGITRACAGNRADMRVSRQTEKPERTYSRIPLSGWPGELCIAGVLKARLPYCPMGIVERDGIAKLSEMA